MGANLSKLKKGIPVLDGRFKLVVSPDGLKAYLVPQLPGDFPTQEDFQTIKTILKEEGLVYGILDTPELEGTVWVLARGQPAIPGRDAEIKFLIDLKAGPRQRGDRLDFREVNRIVCVAPQQPIAHKIPATPGKPGKDVFGQEIPARRGKDISFHLGENVYWEKDTGLLRSKVAGVVKIKGHKFEVKPSFVLEGDVDWDVGNIRFCGEKLTITGGIKRGFKVWVDGDLEIQGFVEDEVSLEVTGQLTIKGLAHGKNLRIKCHKMAFMKEVEYASLEIKQNLQVSEYLLQARVSVGGNLLVTEKLGAIIGGQYLVRGEIIARLIGSGGKVKTLIHAGYQPDIIKELEETEEKLLLLQEEKRPLFIALSRGLELLKSGHLPSRKIKILENTKEKLRSLLIEERKLKSRQEYLLQQISLLEKQKVTVLSRFFPGVTIHIGRKRFTVSERGGAGIFLVRGQQIIFQPLNFTS